MAIYIEFTNLIHGGYNWELGNYLWSPTLATDGSKRWETMTKVSAGDIIIHSVSTNSLNHHFYGISKVQSKALITDIEPTIPGDWGMIKGYKSYYKVKLSSFQKFEIKNKLFMSDFLTFYTTKKKSDKTTFYDKSERKPKQIYLWQIDGATFDAIIDFLKLNGVQPFSYVEVSDETDSINGSIPSRVITTTSRIVRDTEIINDLKKKYNHTCQICGLKIRLNNGNYYSEGHHIQPLGSNHSGPDIKENIMILCPNHHTEFDYGLISIDPNNMQIKHVDPQNIFHNKRLAYTRNDISIKFIDYHETHIFGK